MGYVHKEKRDDGPKNVSRLYYSVDNKIRELWERAEIQDSHAARVLQIRHFKKSKLRPRQKGKS